MGKAPASIMVVSILGIIYGGLGLLLTPCSAYLQFHPLAPNPMLDALNRDTPYMVNYVASLILHSLLASLLLVSSIASLKLKRWGRKGMLVYAFALISATLLNSIMSFIMLPKMEAAAAGTPAASFIRISGIVGIIFALFFCGAIVSVIFCFFNRRIAVDAFNGIFPAPPGNFPVDVPNAPLP